MAPGWASLLGVSCNVRVPGKNPRPWQEKENLNEEQYPLILGLCFWSQPAYSELPVGFKEVSDSAAQDPGTLP